MHQPMTLTEWKITLVGAASLIVILLAAGRLLDVASAVGAVALMVASLVGALGLSSAGQQIAHALMSSVSAEQGGALHEAAPTIPAPAGPPDTLLHHSESGGYEPHGFPAPTRMPSPFVDERDIQSDPTRATYESGTPPPMGDLPVPARPPIARPPRT